jgi:DNA-binding LacI/PurR family transcriptional regulator
MPQPPKRVTQKDIAERLGLHRTTVCLALKRHPNIPEKTRDLILKTAEELGYEPDPMLSALAVYRNRQRPASFHGTLAWLVNWSPHYDWRKYTIFKEYFRGAQIGGKKHGFAIQIFNLNQGGMGPGRLANVLYSQNISGILVCPQPEPNARLDFPWERFSALTFGNTLAEPALHVIAPTQYRAALHTMEQIRAQGYRRIGFASSMWMDARLDHNQLSAYLADMYLHQEDPYVFTFEKSGCDPDELVNWVRKTGIDAAMVSIDAMDMLRKTELRIPGDLATACPSLSELTGPLTGVRENALLSGEVAVDFLVAMMQRGERGIPQFPQRVLVTGSWDPGITLPPAPGSL